MGLNEQRLAEVAEQQNTIRVLAKKMLEEEFVGIEVKECDSRTSRILTASVPLTEAQQKETCRENIVIYVSLEKQANDFYGDNYSLNFDVEYSYTRWSNANEYRMSRRGELGTMKNKLVAGGFTMANVTRLRECVGRSINTYVQRVAAENNAAKIQDMKAYYSEQLEALGYDNSSYQLLKSGDRKGHIGSVEVASSGYSMQLRLSNPEHVKKIHAFAQALLAAEQQ